MPIIKIPDNILDGAALDKTACTHPAGHCFGSDGGSGIPDNQKVPPGRGGEFRAWTLSPDKQSLIEDAWYIKCQYCGHYTYEETNAEREKRQTTQN